MDNIMEHIEADGKFAETFREQAITSLGDSFKGTKILDDVPDVGTLIKNYANTKAAYGKKLENVIQRPAANATDAEKAAFHSSLRKELGASENPDDFEMPRIADFEYGDQEIKNEATFRKFFVDKGFSPEVAKGLVELSNAVQVETVSARLAAQSAADEASFAELDKDPAWSGDKAIENGRIAFAAIMEFGDDAMKALVKDSKIYDDPGNHQKWRDLGLDVRQRRILHAIGTKMNSAEHVKDELVIPAAKQAAGASDLVGPDKRYNHPTSSTLIPKTT